MNKKIGYNTSFNPQTGDVSFVTECPHIKNVMLASDDCFRCRYFVSVTFAQQIECAMPVEDVFNGCGGFSEPQPYNLSSERRKPIQTKIQFK